MPANATRIGIEGRQGRAEEYDLGAGTICLAGKRQMVVARQVTIRGLWDQAGDLYGIQLELVCDSDQLAVLRRVGIVPASVSLKQEDRVKSYFEMESSQVESGVLSELGDARSIGELFLAEDRFPPILNLQHYRLRKVETLEE